MADEQQSILKVLVELVDKISEPLHEINENFEAFSRSAENWWTSAAEVFAGYETIEGLIEPAAAMQEKMVDLSLATHAGAEELERYKETAEELAASLPVKGGAEEIADAMAELYKTFRDDKSLKEQTEIAARLAVVMRSDAATAAQVLTSAVENLGDANKPATEQMKEFADELALLRDRFPAGSAGLQRMAMDLRMLGTAAQAYNIPQHQMIALIAEANRLHLGGLRGSGPILQQIIDGLFKVGKTGQTEMAQYGLAVAKFHNGQTNLLATLEQMSKMSPRALRALEQHLPGQAQAVSLLIKHMDDLRGAFGEVKDASGELGKASTAHVETWDSQVQLLSNSFNNLKDTIASSGLLNGLAKLVDGLTHLVDATDRFLSAHPAFAHAIGVTIAGFASLLSLAGLWKFGTIAVDVVKLGGALLRLPTILSMIGNAWTAASWIIEGGIGSVSTALSLLFESNPVGWILTALAAIGFVGYEVWKHWDQIKETIHDVVDAARDALNTMKSWGIGDWGNFIKDLATGNAAAAAIDVAIPGKAGSISSASSAETHLHYSPAITLNVQPGVDGPAAVDALHQVMSGHAQELSDMLKENHRAENRRSFLDTGNPSEVFGH